MNFEPFLGSQFWSVCHSLNRLESTLNIVLGWFFCFCFWFLVFFLFLGFFVGFLGVFLEGVVNIAISSSAVAHGEKIFKTSIIFSLFVINSSLKGVWPYILDFPSHKDSLWQACLKFDTGFSWRSKNCEKFIDAIPTEASDKR